MLTTCHSYGPELTTGYVMNNNHGPYGPDDTKCAAPVPPGHALAKPADIVIFHMREFFSERPSRVLMSALEDMDTDNNGAARTPCMSSPARRPSDSRTPQSTGTDGSSSPCSPELPRHTGDGSWLGHQGPVGRPLRAAGTSTRAR